MALYLRDVGFNAYATTEAVEVAKSVARQIAGLSMPEQEIELSY